MSAWSVKVLNPNFRSQNIADPVIVSVPKNEMKENFWK